ncbi:MAG: TetR/AcrR family transcriptional regulator [Bacillota bacterium]|nr:TetR/AcrR family transcriptional regulator [Bacillota bacterium]
MNIKSKQELKSKATKQKILNIALQLLSEKGFDQMQVNQICKLAGISVGAFYHHFSSKEDIIIETYKEVDEYFIQHVFPAVKGMAIRESIVEYIGLQAKYAADKGVELISQLYKSQIFSGNSFFISSDRALPQGLKEIVEKGQQNHQIRNDLSSNYITNQLLRYARGIIYDWCVHKGEYCLIKEMKTSIELFSCCFFKDNN